MLLELLLGLFAPLLHFNVLLALQAGILLLMLLNFFVADRLVKVSNLLELLFSLVQSEQLHLIFICLLDFLVQRLLLQDFLDFEPGLLVPLLALLVALLLLLEGFFVFLFEFFQALLLFEFALLEHLVGFRYQFFALLVVLGLLLELSQTPVLVQLFDQVLSLSLLPLLLVTRRRLGQICDHDCFSR